MKPLNSLNKDRNRMYFTHLLIAAATSVVSIITLPRCTEANNPYVITDDRARSLDIAPVLGRGYSIMTNTFQSICLTPGETTVPSYNYDYSIYDFTSSETTSTDIIQKLSYTWGGSKVQDRFETRTTSTVQTNVRTIVSVMRIERYYSSIREESSTLFPDAQTLLNRQDYVGFFKACGPNFIRSIRRAQEVTANLEFESISDSNAKTFKADVTTARWKDKDRILSYSDSPTLDWNGPFPTSPGSTQQTTNFLKETQTLEIGIVGYGLGLSYDGSETFVAQSVDDYHKVMKFAFRTMTDTKDSYHVGMVYGFEVAPWVENIYFQATADVTDEVVENPVPISLIPRSFRIEDNDSYLFSNTPDGRALNTCSDPSHSIDKHGYCCAQSDLYDPVLSEYEPTDPELKICRPLRRLTPSEVKDNLSSNGEFIARLDQAVRYKVNRLGKLESCLSAVRAIPERYDFYILRPGDKLQYDGVIDIKMSVFEMKNALDPENDYAMMKHMTTELDEYMEMFVQPCYAALYGSNIGNTPDTDVTYLMAYPWYVHEECSKLSCFGNSMRWDRKEGGCVPSLISGQEEAYDYSINEEDNINCNKAYDRATDSMTCKHSATDLSNFASKMKKYWKNIVPQGRIDHFLDQYCMPELTGEILDGVSIDYLQAAYKKIRDDTGNYAVVNVALNKSARQISTHPHLPRSTSAANLAVDGNTDQNFWAGSTTHTGWHTNPWWEVDLGANHKIEYIQMYPARTWYNQFTQARLDVFNNNAIIYSETRNFNIAEMVQWNLRDVAPGYVIGSKVKITKTTGNQPIDLSEVMVFARVDV